MAASRPYWPKKGNLLEPDPEGRIWLGCGHPRTPENTQHIGKAGDRCRICRQKITREDKRRRRERDKQARRRKALTG